MKLLRPVGFMIGCLLTLSASAQQRPNVLIAISDDQSYPHASAYGYQAIQTPAFDRVAREGILFRNAFTPAPGCSPMRAAFLTGRYIWQLEHAGTHASSFPARYEVFQDRLEQAGYFVGFTGKGWSPGNWQAGGRNRNPAGPEFSQVRNASPPGIRNTDYAGNFAEFLKQRPAGQPFSFWYGASEPHRRFHPGIGRQHGLNPDLVEVPPFLPDTPEIRDDILDYCFEIQWFDQHLGRMLDMLEQRGELENTLVIVTSDNGMAFPRAKANLYEFGIHMPLAIQWPAKASPGRTVEDLVSLIDVTATIYDATGVQPPSALPPAGKSLMSILTGAEEGLVDPQRVAVYSGRERHSSSRFRSLGYPQRCIRTPQLLYIHNFRPERWPAGAPRKFTGHGSGELGPPHGGYHDIDACPSLTLLIEQREVADIGRFFHLAVDHRPREELYDIQRDPGCLNNLADLPAYAAQTAKLREQLFDCLRATRDPRVVDADGGDVFETYPRYSSLRWFPEPEWARQHPDRVPQQKWLDERR